MNLDDTLGFKTTKPLNENSVIICPSCKKHVPLNEWLWTEVFCQYIDEYHFSAMCPNCWWTYIYYIDKDVKLEVL